MVLVPLGKPEHVDNPGGLTFIVVVVVLCISATTLLARRGRLLQEELTTDQSRNLVTLNFIHRLAVCSTGQGSTFLSAKAARQQRAQSLRELKEWVRTSVSKSRRASFTARSIGIDDSSYQLRDIADLVWDEDASSSDDDEENPYHHHHQAHRPMGTSRTSTVSNLGGSEASQDDVGDRPTRQSSLIMLDRSEIKQRAIAQRIFQCLRFSAAFRRSLGKHTGLMHMLKRHYSPPEWLASWVRSITSSSSSSTEPPQNGDSNADGSAHALSTGPPVRGNDTSTGDTDGSKPIQSTPRTQGAGTAASPTSPEHMSQYQPSTPPTTPTTPGKTEGGEGDSAARPTFSMANPMASVRQSMTGEGAANRAVDAESGSPADVEMQPSPRTSARTSSLRNSAFLSRAAGAFLVSSSDRERRRSQRARSNSAAPPAAPRTAPRRPTVTENPVVAAEAQHKPQEQQQKQQQQQLRPSKPMTTPRATESSSEDLVQDIDDVEIVWADVQELSHQITLLLAKLLSFLFVSTLLYSEKDSFLDGFETLLSANDLFSSPQRIVLLILDLLFEALIVLLVSLPITVFLENTYTHVEVAYANQLRLFSMIANTSDMAIFQEEASPIILRCQLLELEACAELAQSDFEYDSILEQYDAIRGELEQSMLQEQDVAYCRLCKVLGIDTPDAAERHERLNLGTFDDSSGKPSRHSTSSEQQDTVQGNCWQRCWNWLYPEQTFKEPQPLPLIAMRKWDLCKALLCAPCKLCGVLREVSLRKRLQEHEDMVVALHVAPLETRVCRLFDCRVVEEIHAANAGCRACLRAPKAALYNAFLATSVQPARTLASLNTLLKRVHVMSFTYLTLVSVYLVLFSWAFGDDVLAIALVSLLISTTLEFVALRPGTLLIARGLLPTLAHWLNKPEIASVRLLSIRTRGQSITVGADKRFQSEALVPEQQVVYRPTASPAVRSSVSRQLSARRSIGLVHRQSSRSLFATQQENKTAGESLREKGMQEEGTAYVSFHEKLQARRESQRALEQEDTIAEVPEEASDTTESGVEMRGDIGEEG